MYIQAQIKHITAAADHRTCGSGMGIRIVKLGGVGVLLN